MKRYALISVSDKAGVADFARKLAENGFDIISTGGTAQHLKKNGVPVTEIMDFTGFPEILDGRVKTLHPAVHGGILYRRSNPEHQKTAAEQGIKNIELVVVNLYPFEQTAAGSKDFQEIIENIDIGGPAMIRSAAKNHEFVAVVVHNDDYAAVLNEIESDGKVSAEIKKELAAKAFAHTALYDSVISNYLNKVVDIKFPKEFTCGGRMVQMMRYGENPHQDAAFYITPLSNTGLPSFKQLHGKELSFNNIADTNAALELVREFSDPAAVIVKHMNPCGVALGADISTAYSKALECDPVSAFGGIVALNRPVEAELAHKLSEIFLEVIAAPEFTQEAVEILSKKKNIRLMSVEDNAYFTPEPRDYDMDIKKVQGGLLLQDADNHSFKNLDGLECPTIKKPTDDELRNMSFAWVVAKHVKSNAIVYVKDLRTIGIGAGQMSRVDSSRIAGIKSRTPLSGAVMASDAFFPFSDSIEEAAAKGISAIISPGGSIRDQEVIKAADDAGISLIFTGVRHFKH